MNVLQIPKFFVIKHHNPKLYGKTCWGKVELQSGIELKRPEKPQYTC